MSNVLTPDNVGHYVVGSGSTGSSSYSNGLPSSLSKYNDTNNYGSGSSGSVSSYGRSLAAAVGRAASVDTSDYGDYIRQALEVSANNTAQSQAFAREMMDFQRESDATAMAWSANEAQKNRDWQERLSNTAHQREVQDLIAAGLNPILSANNGAHTGSGATGQAFSSSGAQGSVDTSASGVLGSLANALINTASQAAIANLYTDATKYTADLNYAASHYHDMTSVYNNNSNIAANKIITNMNNQADIQKANISAGATLGAAATSANAAKYAADKSSATSQYNAYLNAMASRYGSEKSNEASHYATNNKNWMTNPVGYIVGAIDALSGESSNSNRENTYKNWMSFNDYN